MKISSFFNEQISPFVLGAFFSRYILTADKKHFVTVCSYKKSIKYSLDNFNFDAYLLEYKNILNRESENHPFWVFKDSSSADLSGINGIFFFSLENDLNLTLESFFNKLYKKLIVEIDWSKETELSSYKKRFLRGFMELRGSVDTTANYISQDYFYNSLFEIKKARFLVDYLDIPYYAVNLNFRDLQEQFVNDTNKRNTQLRLNLNWYMHYIGLMNKYKVEIFKKSRNVSNIIFDNNVYYYIDSVLKFNNSNIFDDRLNYYSSHIFGKNFSETEISKMRYNLGFDLTQKSLRNSALIELIRFMTVDECAGCKNTHKIETRTFINKNTKKYYLEIHHVISLGNNKELDDENNLVKLCPVCHTALKRGRAEEECQKEIIKNIFLNNGNTRDFAEHFFDTNDFDEIINLTFENLK